MMLPDELIDIAVQLANASSAVTRRYFRAPIDIETKSDLTPVTIADREAEQVMRVLLEKARPSDGIIGEEFGAVRPEAPWQWVLDPIDGTKSFIAGRAIFGTLIALLKDGVPVLGIIDQPIVGDRWLGVSGRPTLFNGAPVRTRECTTLASALLATTSPEMFSGPEATAFESFRSGAAATLYGGDCINYGLLASGYIDLVIEANLKVYDYAALVPVIEGAGGVMVDWSGTPLTGTSDGRVIACGDPRLLKAILEPVKF